MFIIIEVNKCWQTQVRPNFLARNQAKYSYRWHIKSQKLNDKLIVTDKLQAELCFKNHDILARNIERTCVRPTKDAMFKANFKTSFDPISSKKNQDSLLFDVDSVYNCILSLKKGKAAD